MNKRTRRNLRHALVSNRKPLKRLSPVLLKDNNSHSIEFMLVIYARRCSMDDFIFEYVCRNYEDYMANAKFNWDFVSIPLTKEDKPAVAKFAEQYQGNCHEVIADINELGYKVSINWIDTQNSYIVTVSGRQDEGLNQRLSITSWSGDLDECIYLAGYKILDIAKDGDWEKHATEDIKWG